MHSGQTTLWSPLIPNNGNFWLECRFTCEIIAPSFSLFIVWTVFCFSTKILFQYTGLYREMKKKCYMWKFLVSYKFNFVIEGNYHNGAWIIDEEF